MCAPRLLGPQLLDTKAVGVRREKMYKLDEHVACSVAGITGERKAAAGRGVRACRCAGARRRPCLCNPVPRHAADLTLAGRPAADANILINIARLSAQRYYFAYQEPMPVEQLVRSISDTKQVRGRGGRAGACQGCQGTGGVPATSGGTLQRQRCRRRAAGGLQLEPCRHSCASRRLTTRAAAAAAATHPQGYTQFGGQRPFGVSVLYAGW
jgi:hypothetical protein